MATPLGLFNTKLIHFFNEISETYPEERDIKMAKEALEGAKKINPRLIHDLFYEHVYKPLHEDILAENEEKVMAYIHTIIKTQFNEIFSALAIIDKHWPAMSNGNRDAIWKHLKVLILLADKVATK
jgi:hypothetical protein